MNFDRIVEQKIREAQQEGKFDRLQGKGRPLAWDENPFEDPAWATANHLLKENGFRPEWLEEAIALQEQLAQARTALARSRDWRAAQLAEAGDRGDIESIQRRLMAADEWERAVARFRAALTQINRGVERLNLKVPSTRFQRLKLNIEAELQKIVEATSS